MKGISPMNIEEIIDYCLSNFKGTVLVESWGEKGIFYNPNQKLKRGIYVLTIKEKDGENDRGSNLDRRDVFRVNIGIRKESFKAIFGEIPKRPRAGKTIDMEYDFTTLDSIIPHPVYAWMGWISILNPSQKSFEQLKPFLQESYIFAKEKFGKRKL